MFEWVEKLDDFRSIKNINDKVFFLFYYFILIIIIFFQKQLLRSFSLKFILLDIIIYTLEMGQLDRLILNNNSFIQFNQKPQSSNYSTFESQKALSM